MVCAISELSAFATALATNTTLATLSFVYFFVLFFLNMGCSLSVNSTSDISPLAAALVTNTTLTTLA
jgi:hypothetical protein